MPRYFFDFTDGQLIGRDQFGSKLPDVKCESHARGEMVS
jgi:hypothetical protein